MGNLSDIIDKLQAAVTGLVDNGELGDDYTTPLDELQTVADAAEANTAALLTQQGNIKQIVDDEKERIDNNIQTVETSMFSKKRMVELNESARLKTEQYNKILYVFVISVVIIMIIIIGTPYLPMIPEIIPQLLIGMVGSFALIDIFLLYAEMNKRSTLDFSKLRLDPPSIKTGSENDIAKQKAKAAGDLLGSIAIDGCTGPECCGTGVIWDTSLMKCIEDNVASNSQLLAEVTSSVLRSASRSGLTVVSLTTELTTRTSTDNTAQTALTTAQTALTTAQADLTTAQATLNEAYDTAVAAAEIVVTTAAAAVTAAQSGVATAKNTAATTLVDKMFASAVLIQFKVISTPATATTTELDEALAALMAAKTELAALAEGFTGLSNDIGETSKYSKF
jgi:hypothetical protein